MKIDFSERSVKQYKNIALSFLFKGSSVLITILTVPICLSFLSKSGYGVWLVIYSVLGWTTFFDMGLGNGLRTRLSEAIAQNDLKKSRELVSTNYILLSILSFSAILLFSIVHHFINWNSVLNASPKDIYVNQLIFLCFIVFMIKLVLDSINNILLAHQDAASVNLMTFIGNLISFAGVFFLSRSNIIYELRLPFLGIIVTIAPAVTSFIASIYLFSTRFKAITPSIRYFHYSYIKPLFSLGGQFFVIQIAALMIFSTDSFLVSKLFDPEHVTTYNVAYRFFNIFNIAWGIVLTPYWVAFGEAYLKRELSWIRKNITVLVFMWILLVVGLLAVLPFVNSIYEVWVGTSIKIPFSLSLGMALFVAISTFSNIFAYFVNGVAKIRLQVFSSIVAAGINIPLAVYLSKNMHLGLAGVILATCISLSIGALLIAMQYYKIIKGSATGLWDS